MGARKKILYVVHFFHNRGGVEEHVRALALGLEKEFEIAVLAPEDGRLILIRNGQISQSYSAEKVSWPITPYRSELLETGLLQVLNDFQPDIIHVQHFLHWHVGVLEQLTNLPLPVVMSFHDYFVVTPFYTMQGANGPADALTKEYSELIFQTDMSEYVRKRFGLLKTALEKCAARICPSSSLRGHLQEVIPLPFQVIEHGIRPFSPKPSAPTTALRFGFLGSKLPQKGWMELLKAFQILQAEHTELELHFFGGGQSAAAASPGVHFHPAYQTEDLPEILSQYDVGVIPSLFPETFSYVLSEHWMGKKPVAVSRIGSLVERVEDGKNGRFFEPGNIPSILATLRFFVESDEWKLWELPDPKPLESMLEEYRALYYSLAPKTT